MLLSEGVNPIKQQRVYKIIGRVESKWLIDRSGGQKTKCDAAEMESRPR